MMMMMMVVVVVHHTKQPEGITLQSIFYKMVDMGNFQNQK
jgi:hypothetical protein